MLHLSFTQTLLFASLLTLRCCYLFLDVIEDIVKEYEKVDYQYRSIETPKDKVHQNTEDILIQRIEKSHKFSMVGNFMGDRLDIATLIDNASCLEELVEFVCPVSNRSYRYDMKPIISKEHLEFRFEMPDIDFHPMSCVIGLLLRFVATAVTLPSPKRFATGKNGKGLGRTLSMRKEKCFKWLIQDRYLEEYFEAVIPTSSQRHQHNKYNNNKDYEELLVCSQFDDKIYQNKNGSHIGHHLVALEEGEEEGISVCSSKASLVKSVASAHSIGGSSTSSRSYKQMQSLTHGMSSSSLLDPLLSSMQDKLNDSVVSCPPPPPDRKPSVRSVRIMNTKWPD